MKRVSKQYLNNLCTMLNHELGNPLEMFTPDPTRPGRAKLSSGHIYIDTGLGGYRVERICDDGHGANPIFDHGLHTKREVMLQLVAALSGVKLFKLGKKP